MAIRGSSADAPGEVSSGHLQATRGCLTAAKKRRLKFIGLDAFESADRSSLIEIMTFMIAALLSLPFVLAKHRADAILIFFLLPFGPIGTIAKLFWISDIKAN